MPSFYGQMLGPTLNRYMASLKTDTDKEVFEVQEELNLCRAAAAHSVKDYSMTLEALSLLESQTHLTDEEKELKSQLNRMAPKLAKTMMESMAAVVDVAEKAQSIYLKNADLLDVKQVPIMVQQLVGLLYEVCGGQNQKIAEQFQTLIATKLRLPGYTLENESATRRMDQVLDDIIDSVEFDPKAIAEIRGILPNAIE